MHNAERVVFSPRSSKYYVGDEMLDRSALPVQLYSLTLVAKNSNLSIIQMQKILLLTADIKSKPFSNSALPRRTKLFVKRVLNESRRTFVIVRALELVDCHCCDVYDVISHLGRQVTVLNCWKSDWRWEQWVIQQQWVGSSNLKWKYFKRRMIEHHETSWDLLDVTYLNQRFLQVFLELFLIDGLICLHCALPR